IASSRDDAVLRKAVVTYLCDFRGARCHPDQILSVWGMQQAMLISVMALLDAGEVVWFEDPGFHQARRVFTLTGAQIATKPFDQATLARFLTEGLFLRHVKRMRKLYS